MATETVTAAVTAATTPSFRASKTLWFARFFAVAHLVIGMTVLVTPAALHVTPQWALTEIVAALGGDYEWAASVLIVAGIMGIVGSAGGLSRPAYAILLFPQLGLLLLQTYSIYYVMRLGAYPDGYVPVGKGGFILTDQFLVWIICIAQSVWLFNFIFVGKSPEQVNIEFQKQILAALEALERKGIGGSGGNEGSTASS